MTTKQKRIDEAFSILVDIGMPRAQQNERSALTLLALLDLSIEKKWPSASAPLIGITPIMDWMRDRFDKEYAPNTRETIRRQTMHQFEQAGIALYNPDDPSRPVNSPKAAYQVEPTFLGVAQSFGTDEYELRLAGFMASRVSLTAQNAKHREMNMVAITTAQGQELSLSPGAHSQLIRDIVERFAGRFVPGGQLVYVGDTGEKWGYFDQELFASLGLKVDDHGKMPDVILYYPDRSWLILAEAVTSHGPVDAKRHRELDSLFKNSNAGLVFVSAFPDRRTFTRYIEHISWETEVWIADNPSHLVHFNGSRFLGPY
ncbi:MAG: BsuBI/PstI family type II restriction endonuclease [Pseudolabrys sp.]|nr:BsuBI/PstI family type II restriction endonuclease [Pseudolabrys sp.]